MNFTYGVIVKGALKSRLYFAYTWYMIDSEAKI
jgi:hypothetical protein